MASRDLELVVMLYNDQLIVADTKLRYGGQLNIGMLSF